MRWSTFAQWWAQRFANDLAVADEVRVAGHKAFGLASRALSGQYPANRSGLCQTTAENCPGSCRETSQRNASKCPRNGWRNGQEASGKLPLNPG